MNLSNENYIKELEQRLHWCTYEASKEEFDEEEVMAICNILNQLDPIPVDTSKGIEKIIKTLQEKMQLANNQNSKNILVNKHRIKYNVRKQKSIKTSKHNKGMGGFSKLFTGVACILIIFISVNVATYATKEKSFFDTIVNYEKGFSIVVNGHVEPYDSFNNRQQQSYETWVELQKTEEEALLEPSYLPQWMELNQIEKTKSDTQASIFIRYENKIDKLYLQIAVEVFPDDHIYMENITKDSWVILNTEVLEDIEVTKNHLQTSQ